MRTTQAAAPKAMQNLYTSFRKESYRLADLDRAKKVETAIVEADETQNDKYSGEEERSLVENYEVDASNTITRGTYDQFDGLTRTVSANLDDSYQVLAEQTAKTDSNWDRIRRRTETDYSFLSPIVEGENGANFGRPRTTLEVSDFHNQLQSLNFRGLRQAEGKDFPVTYYMNDATELEENFQMRVDYSPEDKNLGQTEGLAQQEFKRMSELKEVMVTEIAAMPRSFSSNEHQNLSTPETGAFSLSSYGFASSKPGERPLGFVGESDTHRYDYKKDNHNGTETFSVVELESGITEFIETKKTKDGTIVESFGYDSPFRPELQD